MFEGFEKAIQFLVSATFRFAIVLFVGIEGDSCAEIFVEINKITKICINFFILK